MTMPARGISLLFVAVIALLPMTAEATVVRAIQFDEKVENASAIVLGRLVAQESRWDAAGKWILTYSTFQVEKVMKGSPSQEITLVTPGGVVGNIAQEVVGVPKFEKGDEHVVFVRNSQSGPTVLYFEQGAYRVKKDGRGDRIVTPVAAAPVLVDSQRGTVVPERARSLREFETSIRDSVRRREAIRMQVLERQKKEEASIWSHVQNNKLLISLALIGVMLAAWQYFRRT